MNGSGKTTLLRVLTGQESISDGTVYFRESGKDYIMNSSEVVHSRESLASKGLTIGFCAQENNLPPTLTLAELIHLFSSLKDSSLPQNTQKQD